jgi:hypothetical protein
MKSKKVLTILLSLAIMLTFMPTFAFAAAGDPDTAKFTVDGGVRTGYSLDNAVKAVSDGGTIDGEEGFLNNSYEIDADKDFTLTLDPSDPEKKVELANGVEITTSDEHCLIVKNGVYKYYATHEFTSASAAPLKSDKSKADVTLVCEHGDSVVVEGVQGEVKYDLESKTVYEAEVEGLTCTWEVSKASEAVYELSTVDYKQDGDGLAILNQSGKVQFYANYTKDGVDVLDSTGKKAELPAVEKSRTVTKAPTVDAYGESTYVVEVTLPNNEKERVTLEGVKDTPKTTVQPELIQGIQLEYVKAVGTQTPVYVWGDTLATAPESIPQVLEDGSRLVVADNGALTYRMVYNPSEGDENPYGEDEYLKPTNVGDPEATDYALKKCGASEYKYPKIVETKSTVDGKVTDTFEIQLPNLYVEGDAHDYDYRNTGDATHVAWAYSFEQLTDPTHDTFGTANAKCKWCAKEWKDGAYKIDKTETHLFAKADGEEGETTTDINQAVQIDVPATCTAPSFKYAKCLSSDGNWEDGEYRLTVGTGYYVFKEANANWHPVLVSNAGSALGHAWHTTSGTWESGLENKTLDDDVTFTWVRKCDICGLENTFVFHMDQADEDGQRGHIDEDGTIHIYDMISSTATVTDCSEYNKYKYSVDQIEGWPSDPAGRQYETTVTSAVYTGAHNYDVTVNWADEYRAATISQVCEKDGCLGKTDEAGNEPKQKLDADVHSRFNPAASSSSTSSLKNVYGITRFRAYYPGDEDDWLEQ